MRTLSKPGPISHEEGNRFICRVIRDMKLRPHSDLIQECWLDLINAHRLHDDSIASFSTYAYIAVKHGVIRYLRRNKPLSDRAISKRELSIIEPGDFESLFDNESDCRDVAKAAYRAMDFRPRDCCQRWFGGETLKEIAVAHKVTRERVRQLIHKGLRQVKSAVIKGDVPVPVL